MRHPPEVDEGDKPPFFEEDEAKEDSNENVNQDLDLEFPNSSEDLEKEFNNRRKRQKLSTPNRSKKLAKLEEFVDKTDVDKINVDNQTQLERRKNLSSLVQKICSIQNENALGSSFDILNGNPPSYYGLSSGKSKLGFILICE